MLNNTEELSEIIQIMNERLENKITLDLVDNNNEMFCSYSRDAIIINFLLKVSQTKNLGEQIDGLINALQVALDDRNFLLDLFFQQTENAGISVATADEISMNYANQHKITFH